MPGVSAMSLRRLCAAVLLLASALPSAAAPPPKVSTFKPLDSELSERPFSAKRILMVSQDVAGCAPPSAHAGDCSPLRPLTPPPLPAPS